MLQEVHGALVMRVNPNTPASECGLRRHDVLFEMLTAEEHLRLFASFKGTDPDKIEGMVS
jgi:ABC-type multidrug transport system ATPase subunit